MATTSGVKPRSSREDRWKQKSSFLGVQNGLLEDYGFIWRGPGWLHMNPKGFATGFFLTVGLKLRQDAFKISKNDSNLDVLFRCLEKKV